MNIIIAGDFSPQLRVADLFEKGKYSTVFPGMQKETEAADYSIVNFECPIVKVGALPITKQGPNLKCSAAGAIAVKYAGFNCVTLANNHFRDYGEDGIKESLKVFREQGLDVVGGGMNLSEASQILYKDIDSKRLAIINCCEHEFSIATETSAGSNPLNPIQQYYSIQEAKRNADKVLVIVHGGHEHFPLPSPRMVETYRFFVDAGADAVVNHHQHCYSGYEIYKGCPIFYGLGNFCFDHPDHRDDIWNYGYLVNISFTEIATTFKLIPYCQCSDDPSVVLLDENRFEARIDEINAIIADNKELKHRIDAYYDLCSEECGKVLEPMNNRFYRGAKRRGWLPSLISERRKIYASNYIMCESHRDKLIQWLTKL
ncbi:MAG: CapA family protein [Bacteroidaceae bacterium]|nr:CapA family protein [Bacteroidaceae bacterium]